MIGPMIPGLTPPKHTHARPISHTPVQQCALESLPCASPARPPGQHVSWRWRLPPSPAAASGEQLPAGKATQDSLGLMKQTNLKHTLRCEAFTVKHAR
eukprot:1160439-Pelagomonas_calceolata.AAC.1